MNENMTAHELLSHALKAHIDAVRKALLRVVPSGVGRRAGAKGGSATAVMAGGAGAKISGAVAKTDNATARAEEADDAEAVHDFRVALRRLRTALKPARDIYGAKKLRSIGADLKRFADVTSALRDEEVLRETLSSLKLQSDVRPVVDSWIARRARQEQSRRTDVVKFLRKDAGGKSQGAEGPTLKECLARLEKRIREPKRWMSAVDLGRRAIGEVRDTIRALGEVNTNDAAAMHALRILFKRLRYTAELFKPALGEGAARMAKEAARLQTRLGDLHDLDEAMVRMSRAWGLVAEARGAVIEALRGARTRMAARSKKELTEAEPALAAELVVDRGSKVEAD